MNSAQSKLEMVANVYNTGFDASAFTKQTNSVFLPLTVDKYKNAAQLAKKWGEVLSGTRNILTRSSQQQIENAVAIKTQFSGPKLTMEYATAAVLEDIENRRRLSGGRRDGGSNGGGGDGVDGYTCGGNSSCGDDSLLE